MYKGGMPTTSQVEKEEEEKEEEEKVGKGRRRTEVCSMSE